MDIKLLIDAIVRQTTVLIAQLSTAAGVRAPLSHVADQVFLELAQEIERQGVGRKVVADMFGMALRTYQKRVQRLSVGGATFSFDVYRGHPYGARVLGLLGTMRAQIDALWDEVSSYNRAHPGPDERRTKVSFYFGQNVDDNGTPARHAADLETTEHES